MYSYAWPIACDACKRAKITFVMLTAVGIIHSSYCPSLKEGKELQLGSVVSKTFPKEY